MHTSSSYKEISTLKDLKHAQIHGKEKKSDLHALYDLKKKSFKRNKAKTNCKKGSKNIIEVSNYCRCSSFYSFLATNKQAHYEIINTPNNMYFDQDKQRCEKSKNKQNEPTRIDYVNYSSVQSKPISKKYDSGFF